MRGKAKKFKSPKITTVIGQHTEVRGDMRFVGGLHVDGTIKGKVVGVDEASSALILSDIGSIEGEVRVPSVVINGTVIGNVYASERIELASKSRITGDVYYTLIEMAIGAEVNGNLVRSDEATTPMLAYDIELDEENKLATQHDS